MDCQTTKDTKITKFTMYKKFFVSFVVESRIS